MRNLLCFPLCLALVVPLALAPSCKTFNAGMLKTGGTAGALASLGLLIGPVGVVVGALTGGSLGWIWADNDRLRDLLVEAERKLEDRREMERKVADLERRVSAIPSAPPKDPTLDYRPTPDNLPTVPWYKMTPFSWFKEHVFK